jgi:hypothetical protein
MPEHVRQLTNAGTIFRIGQRTWWLALGLSHNLVRDTAIWRFWFQIPRLRRAERQIRFCEGLDELKREPKADFFRSPFI